MKIPFGNTKSKSTMGLLPYFSNDYQYEAGCDEAGRGCLAGPVTAAAVILPKDFHHPDLNDSKKLTKKQRDTLRVVIENEAIAYGVSFVSPEEIDEHNILRSSFIAMHRAIDQLGTRPNYLLIDGNRFIPYADIDHACIVKGDGKFLSIAAASVLAKTYRDEYMEQQSLQYPQYEWTSNKGYPTIAHRKAIATYGISPLHRKSFKVTPPSDIPHDLFKK